METNYRTNIAKWLPFPTSILETWLSDSLKLTETMDKQMQDIVILVEDVENSKNCDKKVLRLLIDNLDELINNFKAVSHVPESSHTVFKYKVEHLSLSLKFSLNVIVKLIRNLIFEIVNCESDEFLRIIFRLVNKYNALVDLEHDVTDSTINLFSNDCPPMLERLSKISVKRILQVLAKNRAEEYCHILIDCLLVNYEPNDEANIRSPESADVENSENSSIEIYRALTKHMTPPSANYATTEIETSNVESIQALVNTQTDQVINLLNIVMEISSQLLGCDSLKMNKGQKRIRKSALRKISDYYQEEAWGAVSSILDHVVLWWSSEALAARHSQGAHHLKDWLHQFIQRMNVSPTVRPALQNLCDALGCHVTITAWDNLFRLAYISSFACQSKSSSLEGTDTGQMFAEVFQLLVTLSNECETGGEWVIGAPLLELPLSEQLIVLHRLDHSVHTMRLWAMQESRLIAHTWELENFFLLVKNDVNNCLEELSYLKLADHTNLLTKDASNVQVYVCAKMRAKIVSEVNTNIMLLKGSPARCIKTLATICRVVSLANLHMCFPQPNYWRKNSTIVRVAPSAYVKIYFEKVLLPVLEVVDDYEISNMILKIMCDAWLDYIYLHRIKFSELGALQLLTDFAFVTTWVTDCSIISQNVRNHLLKNEVLRRCEGVGRLLLRHPGEAINMHKAPPNKTNENGSPESLGLERMPAEMYVPNQEQWLELRAPKHCNFSCSENESTLKIAEKKLKGLNNLQKSKNDRNRINQAWF